MARRVERPEADRVLRRLATRGALPAGADPAVVDALLADGLLRRDGETVRLTEAGRASLRRRLSGADGFAARHRTLERAVVHDAVLGRQSVVVNADESPLARLHRTRGRDGRTLIGDAEFCAGERLRAEFSRARLMPRVTANWSAAIAAGRRDGGGAADVTEAAVAARLRIDRAMAAVGPEFAGVLVDFCCFLKGIEEIERERAWPARSAKLVIRLALASLARHYGLSEKAAAAPRASRMRHWGADGYRPVADPPEPEGG